MFDEPQWTSIELDWIRVLLAVVVLVHLVGVGRAPTSHPVGLARVVDLRPVTLDSVRGQRLVNLAVVLFAADLLRLPALVLLAVVYVARLTVKSSRGAVNHEFHLLVVVLLVHAAAEIRWFVADVAFDDQVDRLTREGTAVWWSIQAGAALYFCSGVSKLANSGLRWTERSLGLLLNMRKKLLLPANNRWQQRLAPRVMDLGMRHPRLMRLVFAGGIVVEVFAPVGLVNRYTLVAVGTALVGLHLINGVLLGLPFSSSQQVVAVLWINAPGILADVF
jgi:hypothetical protein